LRSVTSRATVEDRRDGDLHVDDRSILPDPVRVVVLETFAGEQATMDHALLGPGAFRDENRDRPSDDLVRGVPVEAFGRGVPRPDQAVRVAGVDGVRRGRDDGGEARLIGGDLCARRVGI